MNLTHLDPEERAYNTYAGGHSRSNRRGRAIYPDGQVRAVTAGVADTYFTIPAHGRIGRKYVSGFLTLSDPPIWPGCTQEGEYLFHVIERPS